MCIRDSYLPTYLYLLVKFFFQPELEKNSSFPRLYLLHSQVIGSFSKTRSLVKLQILEHSDLMGAEMKIRGKWSSRKEFSESFGKVAAKKPFESMRRLGGRKRN